MSDATDHEVRWRDLAEGIPGCVAVQVDGRFAYVSAELASAAGTDPDAVVGESWRSPFDRESVDRLVEALESVRTDGRWEGTVETTDGAAVDLALSATDAGHVVWIARGDPRPESGVPEGSSLESESESESESALESESPSPMPERAEGPSSDPEFVDDPDVGRDSRLYERPAFVRAVLDTFEDVVYVIDEDGQLRLWNQALVDRSGYTHEEIRENHPKTLIPEDQYEYVPGLMDTVGEIEDRRVEVDLLTKDGERITHEFEGTTLVDPETGRKFRCGIARDVTERKERERELELFETIIETVDDGVYALDEQLEFEYVNDRLCEMFERSRAELVGTSARQMYVDDDELATADDVRKRVLEGSDPTGTIRGTFPTSEGERIFESRYRLFPESDGEYQGSVGVIRDVTDREERQRILERRLDELGTLDRINELLLETVRELIQTASREAVEETVCEQLALSDLYQFVWVGERSLDDDRIVPRVVAGDDRGYLDAVTITTDRTETGRGPAGRAMNTGEVQVDNVADPAFEPWREAAHERGFESVAAVPLHHAGTVYGVMVVYATREDAFSDREQAGFDVLGRTVGSVIHAVKSRELLFADAVVELEFRVEGGDSTVVSVARDLDCTLTLDGYVPSEGRWILYLTVDGTTPDAVVAAAADREDVDRARVVTANGDAGRVELVVAESSLLHTVTGAGATLRTASARSDGADLVVDAPAGTDVRSVVETIREDYPGSTLLARRERDRDVTTVGRPAGVLDDLTDRQREALEAAYRAGYFDWPRESTAEDVAASLNLASPTLHGHLRKAERTILAALLDDRR